MTKPWIALCDRWIARTAQPIPAALAAVSGLRPAVVVTGGSSGIGLAIAHAFAREGETVVLVARNPERLASARASFGAGRTGVFTGPLDVTTLGAPAALDAALTGLGLYLDILVNSAGIGLAGAFESHKPEDIDRLLALNIAALTRLTRHAVPQMRARARGGVLNVSSLGGYVPGPNQAAYYASKAYVCSLTEALAAELAGTGVRMMVLAPGPVDTKFHDSMGAGNALYRWLLPALSPERAARAAVFGYRLGRRVVVPGLIPKALAVAVTVLPHALTAPLLRAILAPRI